MCLKELVSILVAKKNQEWTGDSHLQPLECVMSLEYECLSAYWVG